MDKSRFRQLCEEALAFEKSKNTIGTLSEKTLHAVLKRYFDDEESHHEIKVGSYFADISGKNGIIEIQTRNFDKIRKKLEKFLEVSKVTVVYPIASTKWLIWIDEETGEITKKRKSPKTGTPYEIFYELYKIKQFLTHPNLQFCIVLIDIEEYRLLNGWSKDRKKGSTRHERIPIDIIDEIYIENVEQYNKFLPADLPSQFTSKDYKKATSLNQRNAQTALNILFHVGAIDRVGKKGNQYLYELANKS
jgi:hypothetical protein